MSRKTVTQILVVDDSASVRGAMRIALESRGYSVIEAEDGRAALRAAREHFPDLVVIDLEMPTLNGWQTARALRSDFRTADVPVLATTVRGDIAQEEVLRAGFSALMRKPFTLADLVQAIQRFSGTASGPPLLRDAPEPGSVPRAA